MPATSKPKLPYCGLPFTPACAVAGAEGTDSMPTPANALDASTTANFLIISTHSDDSAILRQGIQKRARRQSRIACFRPQTAVFSGLDGGVVASGCATRSAK